MGDHAAAATDAGTDIYESPDALDAYLANVRARREQRRHERERRRHLEASIAKVAAEFQGARSDDDAEIAAELQEVLDEFARRLQALTTPVGIAGASSPAHAQPDRASAASDEGAATADPAGLAAESPAAGSAPDASAAAEEQREALATAPEPPALSAEEQDALARPLLAEVEKVASRWRQIDAEGLDSENGTSGRARFFSVRVLGCELGRLHAEAARLGVADRVRPTIIPLRDTIDIARQYASDGFPCWPFEEGAWTGDRGLSADEWERLAARYEVTARARQALHWYQRHPASHGAVPNLTLLNSIAAAQQVLFRELDRLGGQDRLQACFYAALRDAARDAGYLSALSAEMSLAELDGIAARLPELLAAAEHEESQAAERQARVSRRADAVRAVVAWHNDALERGLSVHESAQEADALHALLDECQAAGVPPTNPDVRAALLECGPALLAGQPRYARVLEAILADRQRRGMDEAADLDDGPDEDDGEELSAAALEQFRQIVADFVADQKLLILGGVARPHICEELQQALGCAEVRWLSSKRSDKAGKFQADIKRSHILMVVKNFAGHDMSEKGREWIRSVGGHFLLLPSGYGTNQITYQLYKYANQRNGRV